MKRRGLRRDKTEPENMTRLIQLDRPLGLTTMTFPVISRHGIFFSFPFSFSVFFSALRRSIRS